MTKPIFYEGQEVGCLLYGEGVVVRVDSINVTARFNSNHVYNLKGVCYYGGMYLHSRPTLYPIEQYRAIIANLPAPEPEKWQPKPGEWCWFWDDMKASSMKPVLDRFISMRNGKFQGHYLWDNCAPFTGELPEHLKEAKE